MSLGKGLGVTVIVTCFNHEAFVGSAIESALAQDHPSLEVIVIDDCSTDGSRSVIANYADRVRTVFLPKNGGQLAALNQIAPTARHEIVMFLDSDDVLEPHAASTLARNWQTGLAKIQFPMKSINAEGHDLNHIFPKYPPHLQTETLRQQLIAVGKSYCTPGSGNAYAKWFLDEVLPIQGPLWMDGLLEIQAPFCGEVKTLPDVLARYRMHSLNDSNQSELSAKRFSAQIEAYELRLAYLANFLRNRGINLNPEMARTNSASYIEYQIAASKLSETGDRGHVRPTRVIGSAYRSFTQSPDPLRRRLALLVWVTLVGLAPRGMAMRLLMLRFVIASRPRWLEPFVSRVGS